MGKIRTMSICLTDIKEKAAERIVKAANGKLYITLQSYDYDETDQYGKDFSLSLPLTKDEIDKKNRNLEVKRIFVGNGKILEEKQPEQPTTQDIDDLPF